MPGGPAQLFSFHFPLPLSVLDLVRHPCWSSKGQLRQANNATIKVDVVILQQKRWEVVNNDNAGGVKTNILTLPTLNCQWQRHHRCEYRNIRRRGRWWCVLARTKAKREAVALISVDKKRGDDHTTMTTQQQRQQWRCHWSGRQQSLSGSVACYTCGSAASASACTEAATAQPQVYWRQHHQENGYMFSHLDYFNFARCRNPIEWVCDNIWLCQTIMSDLEYPTCSVRLLLGETNSRRAFRNKNLT